MNLALIGAVSMTALLVIIAASLLTIIFEGCGI